MIGLCVEKFSRLKVSSRKRIEELMEDALEGFIGLDVDTKDVVVGEMFNKCKLSSAEAVLIGLLSYKAMYMIGWRDTDAVSAKEISEKLGLNYNTVRKTLSKLVEAKLVERRSRGLYALRVSALEKVSDIILRAKHRCVKGEAE